MSETPPPAALPAPRGRITAIVPLKALDKAKGRLAGDLDASSRRALVAWMFGRVMAACHEAALVTRVLVVAGDRAGAGLAAEHDAQIVVEPRPGLQRALATAEAVASRTRRPAATLVVAADLPLALGADLDRVCAAGGESGGASSPHPCGPAVVVAPTRDGGTGALYRRPPAVIGTRYGPGSAAAHLRLAAAAGVNAVLTQVPGLALDVDTAGQLREAAGLDREVAAWLDREVAWTSAMRDRLTSGACAPPEG